MSELVPIALFGWLPITLALFALFRGRTALLLSMFGAWMFLPMMAYDLRGIPQIDKFVTANVACLIGLLVFDHKSLRGFHLSRWDVPALALMCGAFVSMVTNGYGAYDGMNSMTAVWTTAIIAYFLGRVYFRDEQSLRTLATAFVIAGCIYVPLCLYEMRMSPQLHRMVYGQHQHAFTQTYRMGGWRPMVFMQHGLALSLFMGATALAAIWLWISGVKRHLLGVPMWAIAGGLTIVTVMCRSIGSLALTMAGIGALVAIRMVRHPAALALLALLPLLYMGVRVTNVWDGRDLVEMASEVHEKRGNSLESRLTSEDVLLPGARSKPVLGHGHWVQIVTDSRGRRTHAWDSGRAADALWIITFSSRGLIGLGALTAIFLLPTYVLFRRQRKVVHQNVPAGLAAILVVYMCDNLFNAMFSAVFFMTAGAVISLATQPTSTSATSQVAEPALIAYPHSTSHAV